jgi:hypothetical protein
VTVADHRQSPESEYERDYSSSLSISPMDDASLESQPGHRWPVCAHSPQNIFPQSLHRQT